MSDGWEITMPAPMRVIALVKSWPRRLRRSLSRAFRSAWCWLVGHRWHQVEGRASWPSTPIRVERSGVAYQCRRCWKLTEAPSVTVLNERIYGTLEIHGVGVLVYGCYITQEVSA